MSEGRTWRKQPPPIEPAAVAALAGFVALVSLALLLLAAGCDPELREIEIGPRLPLVTTYEGGTWEALPVLSAGRSQLCFAAWSLDNGIVGGEDGLILRWRDGKLWNADFPMRADIWSLAVHRPGVAYALTGAGSIYRCDGREWVRDRNVDGGWGLSQLWCDLDGRVTVIGHHGRVLQRVGGVWSEVNLGIDEWLYDIWGPGDGELWIVGEDGVVLHQEDGAWSVTRPFGPGERLMDVTGDGAGNLVVLGVSGPSPYSTRDRVHARRAGRWQDLPDPPAGLAGVVLMAGLPLVFSSEGVALWSSDRWTIVEGAEWPDRMFADPVVIEDTVLAFGYSSDIVRWSGGQVEMVSEALGAVRDVAVSAGDTLVLTGDGRVLCRQNGIWEREFEAGDDYYNWQLAFQTPAGDALSLLAGDTLWTRRAGQWTPHSLPFGFARAFTLGDGSLCLWAHSGGFWSYGADGLRSIGALMDADGLSEPVAVAGPSGREFWFLTGNERLGYYDGVRLQEVGPGVAMEIRAIAWDPREGLLLYGESGLYLFTEEGTRQVTPRRDGAADIDRYWVSDVLVLPDGDCLVWASPNWLYRCRDGVWDCPHGAGFRVVEDRQSNDLYGPRMTWRGEPYLDARTSRGVLRAMWDAVLVFRDPVGPATPGPAAGGTAAANVPE